MSLETASLDDALNIARRQVRQTHMNPDLKDQNDQAKVNLAIVLALIRLDRDVRDILRAVAPRV